MPRTWDSLSGRNVLITGGSRGLGLSLAHVCAKQGARVLLLARQQEALHTACEQVRRGSGRYVESVVCDLREPAQIASATAQLLARHGQIDVLINNAGIIQVGPAEPKSIAEYEQALAVHFWAPLHMMRALLPAMKRQGGGRIVNVSSVEGKVAFPRLAPYCASKFALIGLSNAMRAELARDHIYITTVAPGLMHGARSSESTPASGAPRWLTAAARMPLLATPYERAARRIVRASLRGSRWLELDPLSRLLIRADALAPSAVGALMACVDRFLPRP